MVRLEKTKQGITEHGRAGQTQFIPKSRVKSWCKSRGYSFDWLKKQPYGMITSK